MTNSGQSSSMVGGCGNGVSESKLPKIDILPQNFYLIARINELNVCHWNPYANKIFYFDNFLMSSGVEQRASK